MTHFKLRFSLTNDAILHFFHNEYWSDEEIAFLNDFYFRNFSDRFWKLKMRLLYEENNDVIVAAVFVDANFEERYFLTERFLRNSSFVKIGNDLHVHPNALQRWRDKFFYEISSLMNFDLPDDDIFSRNKVETLIFVIERNIVFFEDYGKTDSNLLLELKSKLQIFQNLLFAIRYFLNSDSFDVGNKIIRAKILNPSFSAKELEKVVGFFHTTISKHFLAFSSKYYTPILRHDA